MNQHVRRYGTSVWWLIVLAGVGVLVSATREGSAGEPQVAVGVQPGGSSHTLREDAVRAIPLDRLDEDAQRKVQAVLANACFFRRMPTCSFSCHPKMYLYLVEHPDILVNIWQLLGITQLKARELEPGKFHVVDAAGTKLVVRCLYSSHKTHVFYSEGIYDGRLFVQPVHGRGVMVLTSAYVREPNGCYYVTNRLDVFMSVDRVAAEVLTRTFQPLLGKVADYNFTQTMAFVGKLWQTTERKPAGVQRLASRLTSVRPEVREGFADLAAQLTDSETVERATDADPEEQLAVRPDDSTKR